MKPLEERPLFIEGIPYDIELNTCTFLESAVYLGTKTLNGKRVLVFETTKGKQLEVNPSFHTFIMESGNLDIASESENHKENS